MAEQRPTDEERKKERAAARPPSPKTSGGGFDVQPTHLYYTSLVVRDGQFDYDKGATALVEVLNKYSQSAEGRPGADAFAAAYKSVTEKFLELWAKSVVSVGGVAVGLTHGEQDVQADWQARRLYGPPPVEKAPPVVIEKPPKYGPVNDIKWSGTGEDADSSEIAGILGEIPDFLADVIRPAIEHGLQARQDARDHAGMPGRGVQGHGHRLGCGGEGRRGRVE
ncbi:hypothetical protein LT493_41525 [Streptomyces tricolor]|nr:hypothetical protein [Streptomyces tricolor]